MVLKRIRRKMERMKARYHGMTVAQLRAHQESVRVQQRETKVRLREKERREQEKFEAWKIEQKFKQKRKQHRQRKPGGGLAGALDLLAGKPSDADPFGIFGPPSSTKRKRRKRK